MRFDSFTIFLIVLIIFVVIILLTNWFANSKEGMISFHSDKTTGNNIGKVIHIPQYSGVKNTNTVISLYDSLYYDYRNGTVIEVFSPKADGTPSDNTGDTITGISVIPRDGSQIVNYTTPKSSEGYSSTTQSLVTSVNRAYNQFHYTTTNTNNTKYQIFYISWHTNTYIYLVDLSTTNSEGKIYGSSLFTYILNTNGLITSPRVNNINLPPLSSFTNIVTLSTNTSHTNIGYVNGANLYKIATSTPPTGTSSGDTSVTTPPSNVKHVSYDTKYGNIVIDGPNQSPIVYNREGNGTSTDSAPDSFAIKRITSPNIFIIKDFEPYAAILVIATGYNTIISIVTPSTENYNLLTSVRFNRNQVVTNISSDTDNSVIDNNNQKNQNDWDDWSDEKWNDEKWKRFIRDRYGMDDIDSDEISEICGDELSCKWYWYFNSIGKDNKHIGNGSNILSDDYFLKTEVVPPVCPQCPMCPNSGICSNCGGNGGSGACNSTNTSNLTPSPTVPGTFRDASGNIFVLYTDSNGNKSYIPQSSIRVTNTAGGQNTTIVDANGQFITTADPNTLGGGLAISTLSFDQLGTSAFNNTGSIANNLIDTTGGLAGLTVGSAAGLGQSAIGLAGNALENVTSLAKGAGSGLMQLGSSNGSNTGTTTGVGSASGVGSTAGVGSAAGTTNISGSNKTFGNMPGKTPMDNYSYYGALQSKGGNYMPVTADFSSFRK
jgi:hypothetical protein